MINPHSPSEKTEKLMYLKIHKSYRTVVALCDEELLGKKFEEGIRQLDCRESFYKDKLISYEEAVKTIQFQMNEDATFNIVGEKSTRSAIESGLIEEENRIRIAGIPFTLVF